MAEDIQSDESNLSNWALKSETPEAFVVTHPDGSDLPIAKSALDPMQIDRIRGLASNESGQASAVQGEAAPTPSLSPIQELYNQEVLNMEGIGGKQNMIQPGGVAPQRINSGALNAAQMRFSQQEAAKNAALNQQKLSQEAYAANARALGLPVPPTAPVDGVSQPTPPKVPSIPFGPSPGPSPASNSQQSAGQAPLGGFENDLMGAYGQEANAIKKSTSAQMQAANEAAKIRGDEVANLQTADQQFQDRVKQLQAHTDRFMEQLSSPENQIRPNQFWENKSTGNKIMAAIGIVLGGMGSQWTGGKNMGLETINEAINRDLEAQKANLSQKNNLLSKSMDVTKNYMEGYGVARANALSLAEASVKAQMAKAASPMVQQQGATLLRQLQEEKLKTIMGVAKVGMDREIGMGRASSQDVATYGTPEQQARWVNFGGGRGALAASKEAADEIRKAQNENASLLNAVDQLSALGPEAVIPHSAANERAQVLLSAAKFQLANSLEIKRQSPEIIKMIEGALHDPTKLRDLLDNPENKGSQLRNVLENALYSKFQNNLLNYQPPPTAKTARPMAARVNATTRK